jgi:hypothetical protein
MAGCGDVPSDSGRVRYGGDDDPGEIWAGFKNPDLDVGDPLIVGDVTLCVEGAQSAEILSVTPEGQGIEVEAFSVVSEGSSIGADYGSLDEHGFDPELHVVTVQCADASPNADLLLQITRTTEESAMARRFTVTYKVGDKVGELRPDYGVILCNARDIEADECPEPEDE